MQSQDYQDTPIFTDTVNITEDNEGRKQVNQYLFLETVGKGAFSKIKKCVKKENNKEEILAVKIVNKESLFRQRTVRYSADGESIMLNNLDKIYEEIDTWRLLNHPHIVKLYEVIDDEEYAKLYMVMEIADKGQIMEYSWEENTYHRSKEVLNFALETLKNSKNIESLSETQKVELSAKWIFSQVLHAVEYLHDNNIVHRDIKLDNILVSSKDKGIVKLADFTVSKQLKSADEICYDCEGTPLFTSPEVSFCLRDGYMPKPADIWAIGICIYTYLTEVLPFNGESDIEVQIATKDNEYEVKEWMGEDLRNLLQGTLHKDPSKRYNIKELKAHKWFNF